jgi:hypothetical protein
MTVFLSSGRVYHKLSISFLSVTRFQKSTYLLVNRCIDDGVVAAGVVVPVQGYECYAILARIKRARVRWLSLCTFPDVGARPTLD